MEDIDQGSYNCVAWVLMGRLQKCTYIATIHFSVETHALYSCSRFLVGRILLRDVMLCSAFSH